MLPTHHIVASCTTAEHHCGRVGCTLESKPCHFHGLFDQVHASFPRQLWLRASSAALRKHIPPPALHALRVIRSAVMSDGVQNDWNDHVCHECLNHRDGTAVECDGTCLRMFHMQCLAPELRPKPTDPPDARW